MNNKTKLTGVCLAAFLVAGCKDAEIGFDYPKGMKDKLSNGDEITATEMSQTKDKIR